MLEVTSSEAKISIDFAEVYKNSGLHKLVTAIHLI